MRSFILKRLSLYKLILYCFIVFLSSGKIVAQTFTIDAPSTIVEGERFIFSYVLQGASSNNFDGPDHIPGITILYGPVPTTYNSSVNINGKQSSSSGMMFKYTVRADKAGAYTLPVAKVSANGQTIRSNAKRITILPPDKYGAGTSKQFESTTVPDKISSENAFVRASVSKTRIYDQEAFVVTFRVYSTYMMTMVRNVEFPEFEGFITEELYSPTTLQVTSERVNGINYYAADLKRFLLFPQRSGKLTIPSGKAEIVFSVRTGKQYKSDMGAVNISTNVSRMVNTTPKDVTVKELPSGKPADFVNAVGSFTANSSISAQKINANNGVTITLNISGTGNLKLIKTPEIDFPSDFEVYDPKISNDVKPTNNGLTGTQKIEYYFIPRQEGKYEIPATTFSYFDPASGQYKKLQIQAFKLDVAKDPNGGINNSATSYNKDRQEEIKDITNNKNLGYKFTNTDTTRVYFGSVGYFLWYIIPSILLTVFLIYYRKQLIAHQDVVGMKTKRANKVAIKRLKDANTYLSANNKDKFYEEILRAVWGYLSDKLNIPVANLNRENIEHELKKYGASENLINSFIYILDTCEYARYSQAESHTVMDGFYNKTIDVISEMESVVKIKK